MTAEVQAGSKGRKRGGPLRLSREMIVEAARRLDPRTLTMQAVADELDVDRKALNYHVKDRDGLLRLVAVDVFRETSGEVFRAHFEASGLTPSDDWRSAIRAWAVAVRDAMVATGVVQTYFPLGDDNLTVLDPVEFVLQQLLRAGFDLPIAGRALTFVTNFAMGVGRDMIMQNQLGEHPQAPEVRALLASSSDTDDHEAFRRLASLGINSPQDIDDQFDFEIALFITGMEHRLPDRRRPRRAVRSR